MKVKFLNATNYANIYGLFDENEKCIGTKEVRLAGIDCNTYFDSWSKYTKREIKKMFREIEKWKKWQTVRFLK